MRNLFSTHSQEMALAVFIWLCALPLVIVLVLPAFGLQAAALVAAILLLIVLVLCWGLCYWSVFKHGHNTQ